MIFSGKGNSNRKECKPPDRRDCCQMLVGDNLLRFHSGTRRLRVHTWPQDQRHQVPRRYRSMHNGQRLISGDWGMNNFFRKRMNRPKRMRQHRQKKREKYLESMSRRENNILDLTATGSSFTRTDLDFVLAVKYGVRYDFRSVTGPYVYGQVSLSLAGCIPIEYDKGYC